MPTLPLNIDMRGRLAVVVGGGKVALRKVNALIAANATIRLTAVDVCPEIGRLAEKGLITVHIRRYAEVELDNAFLVVAATNSAAVNQTIAADALRLRILVSVADNPLSGNCTFPAVLRREELVIAVSTGGRCPSLATDVRDIIADVIIEEYGVILEQLAVVREKLLTDGSSSTYNTQVLRSFAKRLIAELNYRKDTA